MRRALRSVVRLLRKANPGKRIIWAISHTTLALVGLGVVAWGVLDVAGAGWAKIIAGSIWCLSLMALKPPGEGSADDKPS